MFKRLSNILNLKNIIKNITTKKLIDNDIGIAEKISLFIFILFFLFNMNALL